ADIYRLEEALRLPARLVSPTRVTADRTEALCLLLRRRVYPNRHNDLLPLLGRSVSELSIIFNCILDHIHDNFGHLLQNLHQPWLSLEKLNTFAQAVANKGPPLQNCWGFIDGSTMAIAKPKQHQKVVFSGHKRIHCLKFQGIMTPNGLFAHMFGPMEGRRHDAAMFHESGIMTTLEETMIYMNRPDGTPLCLYGDPAYPLRPHAMKPFMGARLTREQEAFNKDISSVRISVEWGFGKMSNLFAFVDFKKKKNLKLHLQPVGKIFLVATILANCHTCLYSSQTSEYFNLSPPSLEEYRSP
ncbi:hypothetical protein PoB_007391900, partial [Plakobranchus ocellatus]